MSNWKGEENNPRNRKTKVCSNCKVEKPRRDFYIRQDGRHAGLLTSRCRQCTITRTMDWQKDHPEQRNAARQRYYDRYYRSTREKRVKVTPAMPPTDVVYYAYRRKQPTVHALLPEQLDHTLCGRKFGIVAQNWSMGMFDNALSEVDCAICQRAISRRRKLNEQGTDKPTGRRSSPTKVNHPAA